MVVPTTEGFHVFYLEKNDIITTTYNSSEPYNSSKIRFAALYYSTIEGRVNIWFDVASMLSMPWGTIQRLAQVEGAEYNRQDFIFKNFVDNGDGSDNAHAQFGLNEGTIYHKDTFHEVVHSTTPTEHFEQDIDVDAKIPIYYKVGVGLWRKKDATDFPFVENLGGRMYFNENVAGTWQLTEAANNSFVAVYYYATLNPDEPIVGVLGSINGSSPSNSISQSDKYLSGFPNATFAFLKTIVFNTSDQFTNDVKARIFAITEGLDTLNSDRYVISAEYGGNAGNNRWLEISNSESSNNQPVYVPEDSIIRTVTLQSTSNIGNNKSIAFYEGSNLGTPRFTVVVPNGGEQEHVWDITEFFTKGESIAVRVLNGSISKPVVRFWIETNS